MIAIPDHFPPTTLPSASTVQVTVLLLNSFCCHFNISHENFVNQQVKCSRRMTVVTGISGF